MRIAVPITAESMDEALRDMDRAAEVADMVELRIDYMSNPNLERLLKHSQIPKIVTNRTKYEGGRFQGSEDERIAYIQEAISLGAEYVDIELSRYRTLEKGKTKIIISYHNFDETPNLARVYAQIAGKNPDIVKIATKARNYDDSLRMLNLISETATDREIIGICMGREGIMTGIYGPILGSYLTFASLGEGKSSAPGQLTVDELRNAWRLLQME